MKREMFEKLRPSIAPPRPDTERRVCRGLFAPIAGPCTVDRLIFERGSTFGGSAPAAARGVLETRLERHLKR